MFKFLRRHYVICLTLVLVAAGLSLVLGGQVFADKCAGMDTILIDCESKGSAAAIFELLGKAANVILVGVGVMATIGISVAGVQYLTAGGNIQNTVASKLRLWNIALGLLIYVLLFIGTNFLLPAGYSFSAPNFIADLDSFDTTSNVDPNRHGDGGGVGRGGLLDRSHRGEIYDEDTNGNLVYNGSMGTAGTLNDDTVIITIYAASGGSSGCGDRGWSSPDAADAASKVLNRMDKAMGWTEHKLEELDVQTRFTYYGRGGNTDSRLRTSPESVSNDVKCDSTGSNDVAMGWNRQLRKNDEVVYDVYLDLLNYILTTYSKAELDAIKADYNADNVVFMFLVNGPGRAFAKPLTQQYYGRFSDVVKFRCYDERGNPIECDESELYFPELCFIFTDGQSQPEEFETGGIAHEVLHLFGADDLYCEGDCVDRNRPLKSQYLFDDYRCDLDIMGYTVDVTGPDGGASEITTCTTQFLD